MNTTTLLKQALALLFVFYCSMCSVSLAQAPQGFRYQAVVHGASGAPVANKPIAVKLSLLQGISQDVVEYTEYHNVTTNASGLFSVIIGYGSNPSKDFYKIDWRKGSYFVKTEIDVNNGSSFTNIGTTELLSVPYALFAQQSAGSGGGTADADADSTNEIQDLQLTDDYKLSITRNNSATMIDLSPFRQQLYMSGNLLGLTNGNAVQLPIPPNYWKTTDGKIEPTATTSYVGIGGTPSEKLHVQTLLGEGFLVSGSVNNYGFNPVGAGAMMYFFPSRAAFRAGSIETQGSTLWENNSVGTYSAAFGREVNASGLYGFAAGNMSTSSGTASFVFGEDNIASGDFSVSFGKLSKAIGYASVSLGYNNTTNADYSFAVGKDNTVASAATGAFVGGYLAQSQAPNSLVYGNDVRASGFAEGAAALGGKLQNYGKYSFSSGYGLNSYSMCEFVIGQYNTSYSIIPESFKAWLPNDRLFVIGNGTSSSQLSDALIVWKDGKMAIGTNNRALLGSTDKLYVAGDINANGIIYSSDIRYKLNIEPIPNALQTVTSLQGVYFDWDTTHFSGFSTGRQVGFIAQEVEKVLPQVVKTAPNGYKSVDYAKITSVLVQAVKEQQQTIDSLQQTTTSQQQVINDLLQRVKLLEDKQ